VSFPDQTENNFYSEIKFKDGKYFVTISGKFDWTEALFEKCFKQIWEYNDIKHLEIDCRHLISSTNEGNIGHAFISSLEVLRQEARKRRVRLVIRFESPKQITALINLVGVEGKPILKSLRRHLVFDNPD